MFVTGAEDSDLPLPKSVSARGITHHSPSRSKEGIFSWLQGPEIENAGYNYLLAKKAVAAT